MIEYLKSEQEDNTYASIKRFPNGSYILDYLHPVKEEPKDGSVIGTYAVYESGYDHDTGETYDEYLVEFYE